MSTYLRVVNARLPVADPIGLYTESSHGIMLRKLREEFVGKCYQQCMILEIGRIIVLTAAEIGYTNNTGEGHVDVQFEATVLQPTVGSIICGCTVRIKTDDILYAYIQYGGTDRGSVSIPMNDRLRSIAKGQRIIVTVEHILFSEFYTIFNVIGSLYEPSRKATVYECERDYELSTQVEELAENLVALRTSTRALPGFARIEAALYGWDAPQPVPPGAKAVDLAEFVVSDDAPKRAKFVASDSRAPAGTVYIYNTALFPGEYTLVSGVQTETMMVSMLQEAISNLHTLRSACEYYGSDEEYARHENMWRVIAAARQ